MGQREPRIDALVRRAAHISESRSGDGVRTDAPRRDREALVVAAGLFALPAAWMLAGVDLGRLPLITFLLATLAYGAASTVEFEVGAAAAVPTQPLLIVMLLLLPAAIVPFAVFVGLGLGSAWIRWHGRRSEPLLATASSAVHAVGPAVVVGAIGLGTPDAGSMRMWLVLGFAFLVQAVGDLASSWIRNCLGLGVAPAELAAMLRWSLRVDVLLAPLGVAAALAFPSGPMAVVVAATPSLLLSVIARDRRGHIDGLIELSSAFHEATDRARRDQLTGLGNRLAWDEALAAVERGDGRAGVIMLDVDWLKVVNDDFGHDAGDRLLRVVAGVVDAVAPEDSTVCRLGGDEFGVLLAGCDRAEAEQIASFVRAGLAACAPVHGTTVSASIGTAVAGPGAMSLQAALQEADRDIYRHKAARGRSRSRPRSVSAAQVSRPDPPMGEA